MWVMYRLAFTANVKPSGTARAHPRNVDGSGSR